MEDKSTSTLPLNVSVHSKTDKEEDLELHTIPDHHTSMTSAAVTGPSNDASLVKEAPKMDNVVEACELLHSRPVSPPLDPLVLSESCEDAKHEEITDVQGLTVSEPVITYPDLAISNTFLPKHNSKPHGIFHRRTFTSTIRYRRRITLQRTSSVPRLILSLLHEGRHLHFIGLARKHSILMPCHGLCSLAHALLGKETMFTRRVREALEMLRNKARYDSMTEESVKLGMEDDEDKWESASETDVTIWEGYSEDDAEWEMTSGSDAG